MEKLSRYRDIIRQVLDEYAHWFPSNDEVQTEIVIDAERDHYELLRVGWRRETRIHHASIHLDIIGGKVWIQDDRTNRPVAEALLEAGVPREDIVLAFHPPEARPRTEFATA